MRRGAVVVALVLVIVGSLAAPAIANSDESASAADIDLADLKANGERPANAPPSVRASGSYSEYAMKYLPTGLTVDDSEDSPSWRYLEPATTVKRDEVQLWSKRGYDAEDKDVTIRVAYWEGEETIESDNETETVPKNVTTHSIDATLDGGYDYVEIPLRSHFDEPVETVVCVEEADDENCLEEPTETRWRFTHHTSAASQTISYNTAGGQIAWAIGLLVLPFAGFSAGTLWVSRKMIRAARSGPRISMLVWVIVAIVLVATIGIFWDRVVTTLVAAPWVLSIVSGILLGILASEWFGDQS
ncbi:MAG: hypothetical protein ACOCUO_00490, partial [archaeon]